MSRFRKRFRRRDRPQYANYDNAHGCLYVDERVDEINQKGPYPYRWEHHKNGKDTLAPLELPTAMDNLGGTENGQ